MTVSHTPRFLSLFLAVTLTCGLALTASANSAGSFSGGADTAVKSPLLHKAFFGFGEDKKKTVVKHEYEVHDDASFEKNTKTFGLMPFGRADLEYEIRLPVDWTTEDLLKSSATESTEALLGDIARYESPIINTRKATVRIRTVKLDTEVDAPSWLENYMLANGYSIQGKINAVSLRSATAAFIAIQNNVTTYNYIAARMSGPYMLVALFEEPIVMKNYMGYLQKKAIDSFHILYPKEEPVETQRSFTLVDAMKFTYPESWIISANAVHDMTHMSVDLQSKTINGKIEGYIRFIAVRRSPSMTIEKAIEEQKKFFTDTMKLKFIKLISTEKSPAYGRFIFNREEDYQVISTAAPNKRPQEIHFVMLGDKEFYIFAFLFTQTKEDNLPNWARNTQSFRVMLQSIK